VNYSVSEENYIKAIYRLQGGGLMVNTNALAQELQTRPASVTDMLKKLKAKKLVLYERYRGFRLNAEGQKVALGIVRRHRLWEYFLAEKLQFGWDEVHEIAEELEHVSSKKLIDQLDAFLNFPKTDPHGDPIPDSNGLVETVSALSVLDLETNQAAEVTGVGNQSSEMLELLRHKNIGIGTRLEVKRRFGFDNSLEIKIRNLPLFTISEQLAKNVLVRRSLELD
jgi:DtxR family transcriptional regulator, Mn-dependent transcriptional regulator